MKLDFLKSTSAQSTMRIGMLLITVAICINLLSLPILIYIALAAGRELAWLSTYLLGLAAVSGTGVAGKVMQKKYEGDQLEKPG